jgi:hypothetical protein
MAEGNPNSDQTRSILQALLTDRFKLAVRRETTTGRVYDLLPARGGLTITPTPPGGCYDPRSPSGPPPVFAGPLVQCDGWRRRVLTPPPDRQDRQARSRKVVAIWFILAAPLVGRSVVSASSPDSYRRIDTSQPLPRHSQVVKGIEVRGGIGGRSSKQRLTERGRRVVRVLRHIVTDALGTCI